MQSSAVMLAALGGFCLVYVVVIFLDKQLTRSTKPVSNSRGPTYSCSSGSASRSLATGEDGKCFIGPPRLCPNPPPNLNDRITVDQSNVTMDTLIAQNPSVQEGGRWKPRNCTALYKIAIIIPFRDRNQHLLFFLRHMHPFLQKQLVDYTIYVVEQTEGTKFNRGFLLNVGVSEAMADQNFDCFFFHDVDMVPENEKNLYHCPRSPTLFSSALSKFSYMLRFDTYFGGVTAMSRADYLRINGFSNRFHGWGAEDDDLRLRVINHGLNPTRLPLEVGRYRSFKHDKAQPNPDMLKLLAMANKFRSREGLSTANYQLLRRERRRLYTWCLIRPRYID